MLCLVCSFCIFPFLFLGIFEQKKGRRNARIKYYHYLYLFPSFPETGSRQTGGVRATTTEEQDSLPLPFTFLHACLFLLFLLCVLLKLSPVSLPSPLLSLLSFCPTTILIHVSVSVGWDICSYSLFHFSSFLCPLRF